MTNKNNKDLKDKNHAGQPSHPEEAGESQCEHCARYKDGWKRALADYDNLKKKLDAERVQMRKQTKASFVQALLPVLDNFDQAVRFKPDGMDRRVEGWLTGILHVQKQLEDVLKEMGATPFAEAGDSFDPDLHDATSEEKDDDKPNQTVLRVVRRGWKLDDMVVRPATVVVNNLET